MKTSGVLVRLRKGADIFVVTALYAVTAILSLRLALEHTNASPVWPPAGIALAAVVLRGYRVWPGAFLGAWLANVVVFLGNEAGGMLTIVSISLVIALGNTLEAIAGRFLLQRMIGVDRLLRRGPQVFAFTAVALTASAVSPSIGSSVIALAGIAPPSMYGTVWLTWWLGDALGMILLAPIALLWGVASPTGHRVRRRAEGTLLLASLFATGAIAFQGWLLAPGVGYPLTFLSIPCLVWAALRFGPRDAAAVTLITSGFAVWATVQGEGPFAGYTPNTSLLLVQAFAGTVTVTILTLAAVAREHQEAQAKLQDAHQTLEARVTARTQDLVRVNETLHAEIADRRRAEEALRTAEARFRGVLEFAPDAIVIVNTAGEIVLVNAQAGTLFGYAREELLGQRVDMLVPTRLRSDHGRHRDAYVSNPRVRPMGVGMALLHGVRKDGTEFPVEISLGPLETPEGQFVAAVVRDITEHRRTEEALRATEAQLRQAHKMEALGQLASGITHDFNNLLTVILGRGEFLLERVGRPGLLRSNVEHVVRTAERAASLTRQLLAFSRKQVLERDRLDLNELVDSMVPLLQRLIPENIALAIRPGLRLERVKADRGQLEQVILNLSINARDAMPHGGQLTIETDNVDLDEVFVRHHVGAQTGPHVLLAVTDTGSGMDAATQQRIFEPFFTTKEAGKGTGLGLATVYGIIKQHDGYLAVESAPGAGAVFRIYLPSQHEDVSVVPVEPPPAARVPLGSGTILLVEDEPDVRILAAEILRIQGYTVLSAANPVDALGHAGLHAGPIALLLTDVVMPEMSGLELAERLRAQYPALKVLYMSRYPDETIAQYGDAVVPFVQKPFTPDRLGRAVHEVLSLA